MILISLITLFLKFRKDKINDEKLNDLLDTRGFVSRMVGPYFKFISHSWHVLPLGFLFGLGFDTASEISLLALSSGASQKAISFVGIISFTYIVRRWYEFARYIDGILMTSAYNWAFFNPIRKIYYNITILQLLQYLLSFALLIGTVELLQILVDKLQLKGSFWEFIENIQFDNIGYILVILFIISWLISTLIWKFGKVEQRWS